METARRQSEGTGRASAAIVAMPVGRHRPCPIYPYILDEPKLGMGVQTEES